MRDLIQTELASSAGLALALRAARRLGARRALSLAGELRTSCRDWLDIEALFSARERSLAAVLSAADELRREGCGDVASYVVTRNIINYTNVCCFRCGTRASGASHGQELSPEQMEEAIRAAGRVPRQRTTLYGDASPERRRRSFGAPPLAEPLNPPVSTANLKRPAKLLRPGLAA